MKKKFVQIALIIALLGLAADPGNVEAQHGDSASLAIGAPKEDVGDSAIDGGAVSVLHPSTDGLSTWGNEYWTQNLGLGGSDAEHNDYFGSPLATGDFNGDGFMDLAVGAPGEGIGSVLDGGAVNIIYGTATWLSPDGDQYLNETDLGILGGAQTSDQFGFALAVGNFNDDTYDDLAIGIPYEDTDEQNDSGALYVTYGSATGLTTVGHDVWVQSDLGGDVVAGDSFGRALAAGDFDEDGYDDLAVSAPYEEVAAGVTNCGAVNLLWGSSSGLTNVHPTKDLWPEGFIHQDRAIIDQDQCEDNDLFGYSLAAGDFNHDGNDDLAIGVPYEDIESASATNGGALHILYGTSIGFAGATTAYFHQDSPDINSIVEANDQFAETLEVGNFNGDSYDDLAVGVPHEDWVAGEEDCGIVQVLFGASGGLAGWDQMWRQDLLDISGLDEADDEFGTAMASGDFNSDGFDDLAVSAPGQTIGAFNQAGMVFVLPGSGSGLTAANQSWVQGYGGLQGGPETGDGFGSSLVAYPSPTIVFYDGFEYGNTSAWSAANP